MIIEKTPECLLLNRIFVHRIALEASANLRLQRIFRTPKARILRILHDQITVSANRAQ